MSVDSDHMVGVYRGLLLEIQTEMCGFWFLASARRSAGASRVLADGHRRRPGVDPGRALGHRVECRVPGGARTMRIRPEGGMGCVESH